MEAAEKGGDEGGAGLHDEAARAARRPAHGGQQQIVLLSNGFQAEYELGFANGLASNGLEPLLVCSDKLLRERLHPGVRTINLRGSQDSSRRRWEKVRNILRYWRETFRLVRRSDVAAVHVIGLFTLPWTVVGLAEALALRLASPRFVLTVHNLLPHGAHNAFNRWCFRLLYRLPHRLIVHTERMRRRLEAEFGVAATRVVVMEHGIDRLVSASPGAREWLSQRLDVPVGRPVVLFFGAVAPYKGLDILIDAFKRMPAGLGAVLVVAGQCRDATLRAQLRGLLEPLLGGGSARWFDGFVPEADVLHYFHAADVLAMPYRSIDQSGVVFMALATGLPVVASDVGSLADYVPLTAGLVVPAGDSEALARGLAEVLRRRDAVQRHRTLRGAERFLWARTVRSMLGVYGTGVDGTRGGPTTTSPSPVRTTRP